MLHIASRIRRAIIIGSLFWFIRSALTTLTQAVVPLFLISRCTCAEAGPDGAYLVNPRIRGRKPRAASVGREQAQRPDNGYCLPNGPINTLRTDYVIECRLGARCGAHGQTYCELSRDGPRCRTYRQVKRATKSGPGRAGGEGVGSGGTGVQQRATVSSFILRPVAYCYSDHSIHPLVVPFDYSLYQLQVDVGQLAIGRCRGVSSQRIRG